MLPAGAVFPHDFEFEHFFRSYNQAKGIEFKPVGRCGPAEALELVKAGMKRKDA